MAAYQGSHVIATDLDDTYEVLVSGDARSPAIDLSSCGSSDTITLRFAMAHDIEYQATCSYDYGYVQVYDGASWVTVIPTPGYDYGARWCTENSPLVWTEYSVDVSSQARGNDSFAISFYLYSDFSLLYYGMYIDMVELELSH